MMFNDPSDTGFKRRQRAPRIRVPMHLKRVEGSLEIAGSRSLPIRFVLQDVSMGGMGFCCTQMLEPNQGPVKIRVSDGQGELELTARVVWCHPFQLGSRILGSDQYLHRAGVEFLFKSNEEKRRLAELCQDLISA